jgi:hypothetical protein
MSNTIEGFESLTKQQIFDLSAKHILNTKLKSEGMLDMVSADTTIKQFSVCLYGGSGCGASVFLTDDAKAKFDLISGNSDTAGGSWGQLVCNGDVPSHEEYLITDLQIAHDRSKAGEHFVEDWKEKMVCVANNHKLDTSILDSTATDNV